MVFSALFVFALTVGTLLLSINHSLTKGDWTMFYTYYVAVVLLFIWISIDVFWFIREEEGRENLFATASWKKRGLLALGILLWPLTVTFGLCYEIYVALTKRPS